MAQGTHLVTIPNDIQLPARLRTPEAAAAIAAANAAAAGGIKSGGFPRLSKDGGKFHIVDGDDVTTLMNPPAAPGQPALPMGLLQVVVVVANPFLSKTFYINPYQPGAEQAPDCSSVNGVTPDSHIATPQSAACATCPQNQWGSAISKFSGKETKACSDSKQLVILPYQDLGFKALGYTITPSEFPAWNAYVKALTSRGLAVDEVQTLITFDATSSHPKCVFSFGGVLTDEESAKVKQRAAGQDVQSIVSPVRMTAPTLPTPASTAPAAPAQPAPQAPAAPAYVTTGFLATQPATPSPGLAASPSNEGVGAPAAAAFAEVPKRKRRTRAEMEAENTAKSAPDPAAPADPRLAHLPAAIQAAVQAVGADSPAGQAILAQYPLPAPAVAPAAPTPGFGGVTTPAFGTSAAPASAAATGMSLRDKLAAKLAAAQAAKVA